MPLMLRTSPAAAPAATSRPRKSGAGRRWLIHLSLAAAFASGAGAALVWPQWIALDGARTALELQTTREKEISDRFDTQRSLLDRLHDWQSEGRRVFLAPELSRYARSVQDAAKRDGVDPKKVEVAAAVSSRWRRVSLQATAPDGSPAPAGEIEPRAVHLVFTGRFDKVFRSITGLCQQQKLFVPERWDLAPAGAAGAPGDLRAEIWATVFVVEDPQEKPVAPLSSGKVAAGSPGEVRG